MAPTVDASKRNVILHEQTKNNVGQLKEECARLATNNDKLVNVIAQNNASKQTIIDLQKRLDYAQKNGKDDKVVNFDDVNKNLDDNLRNAKIQKEKEEKLKEIKLNESNELQNRKSDLKKQQKQLEDELKKLEANLNMKTNEATRIASKKIILEEEILDIKDKIQFERHHFKLMEDALRLDDSQNASRAASSQDYQEFIDNLLKEYAQQFGEEYEKLMKKAQIREKALLIAKKEKLDETIESKKVERDELQQKLNHLGQEIHDNEKRLEALKKELAILEAKKEHDHKNYVQEKAIKDAEVHRLQKENEQLKENIELTQKSANEALKVIIELEFEIKTYEKLLRMEDNRGKLNMSQSMDDSTMRRADASHEDVPLSEITHESIRERKPSSSSSSSSSNSSKHSSQRH